MQNEVAFNSIRRDNPHYLGGEQTTMIDATYFGLYLSFIIKSMSAVRSGDFMTQMLSDHLNNPRMTIRDAVR
jgi:hypothetical protein